MKEKKDPDFSESFVLVAPCESNTAPTDYEYGMHDAYCVDIRARFICNIPKRKSH